MKIKSLLIFTVLVVLLLQFSNCNKLENLTNSGTKLILWSLMGEDSEGNPTTLVLSDVVTNGSVFNDPASASFTSVLLDPTKIEKDDSTFYQNVIIDQIDIEFSRTDGLNVEGKDVPYTFSQKTHLVVETGEAEPVSLGFILMQHNAKSESPLIELVNLGQEHVLKLEAKITFYARDIGGYRLEPAVGYVSVWCANFGDPASTGGSGGGTGSSDG